MIAPSWIAALASWIGALPFASTVLADTAPAAHGFVFFDDLSYRHKPDLLGQGMLPIAGADAPPASGESTAAADAGRLEQQLAPLRTASGMLVLSAGAPPAVGASKALVDAGIIRYRHLAQSVHALAPGLRFGYRGILPLTVMRPTDTEYLQSDVTVLRPENRRLETIAAEVDVIFPVLYTSTADERAWEVLAKATLTQARLYGKPVYVCISPAMVDSAGRPTGQMIAGPRWRRELDVIRAYADGVVLSGGANREWDDSAAWWVQTQSVMDTLR
jgi:hypothetical protein